MSEICKKDNKYRRFIISGLIILALYFFCLYQNKHLQISKYTYQSDKVLQNFDGFKILQVSDLHNTSFGKDNSKLLNLISSSCPDIIVITGDLVHSSRNGKQNALKFIEEAVKIAPVYYISGNHEYWLEGEEYPELLENLSDYGVTDLNDKCIEIDREGEKIRLIGLDDKNLRNNILSDLMGDEGQLSVVLAHEPQYLQKYALYRADLVLSGHAHGGQFRLPIIGGLVAPDQGFFPKYTFGEYYMDKTEMIVSRGLGNSIIPVRLFNYPELVLVELKANG